MTVTRLPLTRAEVHRLQAHMRRHGPRSLSIRQHNQIWDFLLDLPESHAWLEEQIEQLQRERAQEGWEPAGEGEVEVFIARCSGSEPER